MPFAPCLPRLEILSKMPLLHFVLFVGSHFWMRYIPPAPWSDQDALLEVFSIVFVVCLIFSDAFAELFEMRWSVIDQRIPQATPGERRLI